MENASKALIIAGAILISILLISVGIIIMNAINNPVSRGADSASSQAIEMFNSKFLSYDGKVKGSSLKSLISTINASNATDDDHQIALTSSNKEVTSVSKIKATTDYDVEVKYASASTDLSYTEGAEVLAGSASAKSEKGYIFEINIK